MMSNLLNKIDILVLCGGLGTRLRLVVFDKPKPMAEVREKPFLEIVARELVCQGFKRIIFCTGHMGDQIQNYFKSRSYSHDAVFEFSREERPLGTGGAVKHALRLVRSDRFFVINGDTFSNINFNDFYVSHGEKSSPLSIALVERRYSNGQGNVILAKNDLVSSFIETPQGEKSGFASAGCYLMSRDIENYFPSDDTFSLEHDVFPRLAGNSHGFMLEGKFLDIGTPERYASAEEFFA